MSGRNRVAAEVAALLRARGLATAMADRVQRLVAAAPDARLREVVVYTFAGGRLPFVSFEGELVPTSLLELVRAIERKET